MDITLARTFLEIVSSHSFAQAAERLHVTQTAISARVKTLEDLLGRQLFVRNKAGASLTAAGEQFVRHAQALVQVWERARHQVAVPPGRRAVVTVACETSLWDPLMLDWLLWMRPNAPDLALRTEVGVAEDLLERVANGTLDIVIAYAPRHRTGLRIELLIEEKLVMVTTASSLEAPQAANYVYVDWGREFSAQHSLAFPELSSVGVSSSLGPLGLAYLLAVGGAGYFRQNVVRDLLAEGRLHRVLGAPEFLYPAYAVYADNADMAVLAPALAGLRQVVGGTPHRRPRKAGKAGVSSP
ncbi:LysR family transcriptional regulator [Polaromonas sp. SM01]|uniref:LysR family transcriptional regulator n=1 Tax=Polaromonas sp. SM01 TaxID=3085630 RepID=UPI002980D205|nr:LysR family transcriptional regulator [Polaromonas sp. SM01]MDW5443281.1 LysR family transcriptional regulator [Polaromonas sp. SM01]